MSGVFVHGIGAVSPAGWGVEALREALEKKTPLPTSPITRPGWSEPLSVYAVPPAANRPAFLGHARLRRSSVLAQHVVAASMEALGEDAARVQQGALRLGTVVATQVGCVNYSRRFYEEVLKEPATASPLLFPETVFNAPSSHLAAYLNSAGANYTLVGDDGTFVQGLALAAQWLMQSKADICVVVGAEELDWIIADAARLFERDTIYSGGAGAICLKREPIGSIAELKAITDSFLYTREQSAEYAGKRMRSQLGAADSDGELFKFAPIFGKAFNASAAWECVAACDAVRAGKIPAANVGIVGTNEQAIGVRFAGNKAE